MSTQVRAVNMFDDDTVKFEILTRPTLDASGSYTVDLNISSSFDNANLFSDTLNFTVIQNYNNQAINVDFIDVQFQFK